MKQVLCLAFTLYVDNKRGAFFVGLVCCSAGIAFITRAGLGTSPVSGLPFVIGCVVMGLGISLEVMADVIIRGKGVWNVWNA